METVNLPAKYRIEKGLIWPKDDRECARAVFGTTGDADAAIALCSGLDCVVQAGGNMGVWALHLASKFKKVVTFEPDPVNFRALVWNTSTAGNVLALPCALGEDCGDWCDLDRESGNAGAHQVKAGNVAPVMTIDSLALKACDLIYLDIEGFELSALKGANETIKAFRPVIAFEDKGLSERYGVSKGDAEKYLAESHGYKVHSRPNRDVIMTGHDRVAERVLSHGC